MKLRFAIAAIGVLFLCSGQLGAADLQTRSANEPAPPATKESGIWAAIAYSSADEKHGFFWGTDKRQEAADLALEHCRRAGGNGCIVVSVFRNHRHWDDDDRTGFPYHHCAALSVGRSNARGQTFWGSASAMSRRDAEEKALSQCGGDAKECKIREWVCT